MTFLEGFFLSPFFSFTPVLFRLLEWDSFVIVEASGIPGKQAPGENAQKCTGFFGVREKRTLFKEIIDLKLPGVMSWTSIRNGRIFSSVSMHLGVVT